MTEPAFASARQLASLIRRRGIGCLELLDYFIARIERLDPKLNAVVVRDFARARKRAAALDRKGAADGAGPLHGVPMTVKESFDITGLPTSWGDPAFKDTKATRDALAVQRFNAAGAVIFGKSNVPLMLADWQTFNAVYGTTNNPWDVALSPGGSSGGGAAALAAGLTGLEVGSDIGASIRNPAHYCGVFGHKPSWGICPPLGQALGGTVAQADISVIGPLARSAGDLALGLDVMAGPEEIEARGLRLVLPGPRVKGFAGLRVAIMATDKNLETDSELVSRLEALGKFLRKQGAKVSTTARPAFDTTAAHRNYVLMLRATTSSRQSDAAMEKWRGIAARLDPQDTSYLALMARGNIMSHRDFLRLNEERQVMRRAWAAFFQDWDVLLCPAAASAAQPHDQKGERHERLITVNGKRVPTTDQLFWAGISGHFLLPGTVAPLGFTKAGLPFGVQIVGPQYGDRATIHLAGLLEKHWQGFVPPPGFA